MRILIVEDEPVQRRVLARMLEPFGEIYQASSIAQAREAPPVDLILSDWHLRDGTARELQLGVPLVVVSGYDAPPDNKPWPGLWLQKPLNLVDLREAVTLAVAQRGL